MIYVKKSLSQECLKIAEISFKVIQCHWTAHCSMGNILFTISTHVLHFTKTGVIG